MNKHLKRTIVSLSIAIPSLIVTYFASGIIAIKIADQNIMERRGSSLEDLELPRYKIFKNRKDFPSLANREEYTFSLDGDTLYGYLYETSSPKGLVVSAHGVNDLADGEHAIYHDYFLAHGFDVFAIDMAGCGKSSGIMHNLYHSKSCLDSALNRIKGISKLAGLPICLFGHSWGAYGVVSTTLTNSYVKAVASLSGYDTPSNLMYQLALSNVGNFMAFTKPAFTFSCRVIHGSKLFTNASDAVKANPNIGYYIVQGDKDNTVDYKRTSQYEVLSKENLNNVKLNLIEGMGHNSPWISLTSHKYIDEVVEPHLREIERTYGENAKTYADEYISTLDLNKTSEINIELMNEILNFFEERI